MISRIRTVAILMLLAGLALGVLSARTVRALGTSDLLSKPPVTSGGPRIDQLVSVYREEFNLDPSRTDEIRRVLERYDRQVAGVLWDLRQKNADRFRAPFDEASADIREILNEKR